MRFDAPDWDRAVDALRGATEVALACHVNPDGDALGSMLAAGLGFRQLGKTAHASWGTSPVKMPPSYGFLPGADLLQDPGALPETEVFLALDCGAAHRLGELEDRARAARVLVNLDHHPGNDGFGHLNIVVPSASSTAELMTRLLQDLGVTLDRDIATCLYTGLVTDTGRFQYSNSSPDTLRLAADLLALGVPATEIAQEVFESSPFAYLKLVGRVLERATLVEDAGFVYSWIELRDLKETGVAPDETEKLVDLVRSTRAADVAALFKEQDDGRFRVSLRSKGSRSVGAIARANGGGGHELAAGFTASDVAHGVRTILAALAV
ncbi:MAG: bifunctional oligoribonuclease/PAP phosphatase NrnA [Actinomycetota bacterium]